MDPIGIAALCIVLCVLARRLLGRLPARWGLLEAVLTAAAASVAHVLVGAAAWMLAAFVGPAAVSWLWLDRLASGLAALLALIVWRVWLLRRSRALRRPDRCA